MGKNNLEISKDWFEEGKSLTELEKSLTDSGWNITSKTEDKGNELIEAKRSKEGVHEELTRSSKHVNDEKNNFKSHYYSMSYTKKQEFKKD